MSKRTDGGTTGIEWTDHTYNPFVGCQIHTAGCKNCYAMKQAGFIAANQKNSHYIGVVKQVGATQRDSVWTGQLNRAPEHIMQKPRKIKHPSMIFVNSMSDFFHAKADHAWQKDAMAVMADTSHFYQILTKRPENIHACLTHNGLFSTNVMVGVTMEREDYRSRIAILQALKREGLLRHTFLSIEPLVGHPGQMDLKGIDWVIVGGESGVGWRDMKYDWLLSVRDQCLAQGIPLFFKQYGVPENNPLYKKGGLKLIALEDPVGKGGSKIEGIAYKDFPTCINNWRENLVIRESAALAF